MTLFQTTLRSKSLEMSTGVNILLPDNYEDMPKDGYPVLYLLHGMSDDRTTWLRNTRIEKYADERKIAVVMPEAQCSFYTDMAYGLKYYSYIAEELPEFICKTFPVSKKREDNFIAGLSMGGFGALKIGFRRFESFCGIAALSPAITPDEVARLDEGRYGHILRGITGMECELKPEDNIRALAKAIPENARPKLFMAIGNGDFLKEQNENFDAFLNEIGYAHEFITDEGYHNWDFWEKHIQTALKFLMD